MNRLILIACLVAAPAFAQDYGYPGDDESSYQQQPPAPDAQGPTIDDFANDGSLQMNGQWVDMGQYGQVWQPTGVDEGWQPYSLGHWVWTDAGWAWVSDEPFGWAVYHYGRWGYSDDFGWYWVPGRVWAPAWVAWRTYGDYSGWAPLGPRGVIVDHPQRWVWVDHQHFLEPIQRHRLQPNAIPRAGVPAPTTGPRAGPPVQVVQRATGREVRPLVVREAAGPRSGQAGGGSVYFYRPRTAPVAQQPQARPIQRPYYGGVPGPAYGGVQRPMPVQPAQPVQAPRAVQVQQPHPVQPPPHPGQPHAAPPRSNNEQPHPKER
ncbi:MAG TPA: DUF6600 domain-containing protein [Myxococcales bacterium]|nr:DUF6600 domain-containing protein [Myxococcales bacterium]